MARRTLPLGWLQLRHRPLRLVVASAGIGFAVLLILMQLGFRSALFDSAVRYHERFRFGVALFSVDSQFIVRPAPFPIQRLYQALAVDGVADVSPVYIYQSVWKGPWNAERRSIFTMGIDPDDDVLQAPGVREQAHLLRQQDVLLFDALSRPEFGPVEQHVRAGEVVTTEVNDREIRVVGLFEMGTSFGIDASLLTSDTNFLRLFPARSRDQIDLGLVQLDGSVPAERVRDRLRALLPKDVLVLTRPDFIARELAYWNAATPIGYVFAFGTVMGFFVGAIIVYQILFADVSDHLREYATLRAIGYSNRFIGGIVVQQAVILAVLGYIPGVLATLWLYDRAGAATHLPLGLTVARAGAVFALTLLMCAFSGLLALRKVRTLDPAEVF
ncbi:MAG TPA: ABC transporter permease DevC [Myxococcota bacterium]|nr:ABC transporter permease DevC [Myxococcota bacterium]